MNTKLKNSSRFAGLLFMLFAFISIGKVSLARDLGSIEPETLNKERAKWVVLDARPVTEWRKSHIPGAIPFSWEDYTRTENGIPYKVWPPQEMAKALGEKGINEKTPVVVYGDADTSWGGEGWDFWVLAWLGHQGPVRLLSGGIQAWQNLDLPLVAGKEKSAAAEVAYTYQLNPQIDISTQEIEKAGNSLSLIDTRSIAEWIVQRIPGAIHIPWTKFYSGKERRPISAEELKKLLKEYGVNAKKPVVYYCAGGIRSSFTWMVHELSGLPSARNYEGGCEEWKRKH